MALVALCFPGVSETITKKELLSEDANCIATYYLLCMLCNALLDDAVTQQSKGVANALLISAWTSSSGLCQSGNTMEVLT